MNRREAETFDVDVQILHESDKAIKVAYGDAEVWVPKGQIENWDRNWVPGNEVNIVIPMWLAEEKGFV